MPYGRKGYKYILTEREFYQSVAKVINFFETDNCDNYRCSECPMHKAKGRCLITEVNSYAIIKNEETEKRQNGDVGTETIKGTQGGSIGGAMVRAFINAVEGGR